MRRYGDCIGPCGIPTKTALAEDLERVLAELPRECRDYIEAHQARDPVTGQPLFLVRQATVPEQFELREGDRDDISLITTDALDRDWEVMLPDGGDWSQVQRAGFPVTFAHRYDQLPVGRGLWVKRVREPANGWLARTHYVERPEAWVGEWFPDAVWHLVRSGALRGKSIGFIPLEVRPPTAQEISARPELERCRLVIARWMALEWAVAPVQSNPDALVVAVSTAKAAGLEIPEAILETMDVKLPVEPVRVEVKGAIPYSVHGDVPTAPEDTPWDAGREVREADIPTLRKMCAWVDPDNAEVKQGYKLPHHRARDLHVVWNGVRASMGVLLGARGGVDIPEADRRAVYDHLARHYRQFDREPPEFRSAPAGQRVVTVPELRRVVERRVAEVIERVPAIVADAIDRMRGRI